MAAKSPWLATCMDLNHGLSVFGVGAFVNNIAMVHAAFTKLTSDSPGIRFVRQYVPSSQKPSPAP